MKKIQLILSLLITCTISMKVMAETEPNNTVATANVLALNGSDNGAIGTSGDIDWYQITTPNDGKITVSIMSGNSICVFIQLYDNNGTIGLANVVSCSNSYADASFDGLAKGTYFISVSSFYSGQNPTYTLKNTFSAATPANDVEPNGTRPLAKVLPLNSSKTGHVGFLYNNVKDTLDWYKITTTADGRLRLSIASQNNNGARNCVFLQLFDNNGTTELANVAECGVGFASLSVDGLATGTYYALVRSYYSGQFVTYTLQDSLFVPATSNDVEPNNTIASAISLPINSGASGHVGYYYNQKRDSSDWYKIVTNGDGLLKIGIASTNSIGTINCAYFRLLDSDSTTELGNSNNCGGNQSILSVDGLAAGTYFVQVRTYYSGQYATYTLSDTLYIPSTANDVEPNESPLQALTLMQNGSAQGHVGYYNNAQRDLIDWYKITTNEDGALQLSIQSNNSVGNINCAYLQLYDGDGVTELANSANCGGAFSQLTKDGLAAGTYYVSVRSYYGGQFETYTVNSNLITYNPNDIAVNNNPYQASTLPANTNTNGHIGFSYYGNTDAVDWWKFNYTGSGNLTLNLSSLGTSVGVNCVYFELYKDTASSPINGTTNCGSTSTVNFSGLTQGYYYIKVRTYYGGQYAVYSINAGFTQVAIASINLVSVTSPANCTNTNNILSLRCSGSRAPYTVQLFRFGVAYGSPKMVNNNTTFQFTNLPQGVYKATVYGDGATGTAFGSSPNIGIIPTPKSFDVTNITTTTARAAWADVPCAKYYTVQYRVITSSTLTTRNTRGNIDTMKLTGLLPNTTYIVHVAAADSANGVIGISKYSVWDTFTTAPTFIARNFNTVVENSFLENAELKVFPNPAVDVIRLQYHSIKNEKLVNLTLLDITGRRIWTITKQPASSLNNKKINLGELKQGVYILNVHQSETGALINTSKIIVQK